MKPFKLGAAAPIEFTPVFLNYLRFNGHGPLEPKFTYQELANKEHDTNDNNLKIWKVHYPDSVKSAMQKFSQVAKLAED